jgi:hypothetical protein
VPFAELSILLSRVDDEFRDMGKTHFSKAHELRDVPRRDDNRAAKARQCAKISAIRSALVSAGFVTVESQSKSLGLARSTTWKVLRGDQKNSGLSASTVKRMLASTELPAAARRTIEEYVYEKLLGAYGHPSARLKLFRKQLGLPCMPCHREGR